MLIFEINYWMRSSRENNLRIIYKKKEAQNFFLDPFDFVNKVPSLKTRNVKIFFVKNTHFQHSEA